jgi:uncharacterized protein (DUF488 family)
LEQTADAGVFTIGYEGRIADGFIKDLVGSGVQILVDVREIPISRKPGFSKSALSELARKAGIEYLHIRALGSPRRSRRKLKESGDFEAFVREYADHLRDNGRHLVELLELIGTGRRTAIMCFERDHTQCHRSLLVGALLDEADAEFEVYHL